jgi:sugar/nucleoside kinase (ribokinase family)
MNKGKVLTIGSATLDLFFHSDNYPEIPEGGRLSLAYGGKYIADDFSLSLGGGGTNTAVSLARQGISVSCWTKISQDWAGKKILHRLKKEKVKTNLIEQNSDRTTTSAILVGKEGERTIITYRGGNDKLTFSRKVARTAKKFDWVYFASLARADKKNKLKWIKKFKEYKSKVLVSLSGEEYKKGLDYLDEYFALADIIIVNAHELADIWGGDAPDLELNSINYAEKLNLTLLVVTYDVNGSWAYVPGEIYHQPVVEVNKIVDTTGAGDAFGSGFLGKYIRSKDIQEALHFGAKNASSVISQISTQKGLLNEKNKTG